MDHIISNARLTIEKAAQLLAKGSKLQLSKESEEAVVKCRRFLDSKMGDS